MKKIIIILLTITLSLPLFAQAAAVAPEDEPIYQPEWDIDPFLEEEQRKPLSFARQSFEFGIDVGVGFDNNLIMISDLLKKDVVIDLTKISNDVLDTGFTLNLGLGADIFINMKNIKVGKNLLDFGFFTGADGNVNFNIPKSLFTLIAEGNIDPDNRVLDGMISASGGVFADAGFRVSGQLGKLRVGAVTSLYTPLIFIPKSGITYEFDSTNGIYLDTSGEVSIYSPFLTENGGIGELKFGFDVSAEGEYALFPFLDVGGSISRIPVGPAIMKDRMLIRLTMEPLDITASELLSGDGVSFNLDSITIDETYDTKEFYVLRPMRIDAHAKYKPFSNNFLVIRPNIGLSIDFNNEEAYFNAGIGAYLNLVDFFMADISVNYTEAIWTNQLGIALNLRAFELNLKAVLRSSSFANSFKGQGLGVGVGIRLGW